MNFFSSPKPQKLQELLKDTHIPFELENLSLDYSVTNVCSLENISAGNIACYTNTKYKKQAENLTQGVVIVAPELQQHIQTRMPKIISAQAYRLFGFISQKLYPKPKSNGVKHPSAYIDPKADVHPSCQIDAFSVISANAKIGANTIIHSNCFIGENVEIGTDCLIEPQATISHSKIGNHVLVKPGARIGQQGFGFHMDQNGHFDIPQLGCVIIGDHVQIGANTCIDRGSQSDTIIGNHCRIDNLVQIAHNVVVGEASVLVAQVGIAGSTKLGKFVIAAGQVGITGHLNIGDQVKIAAQSGIMRNVESGSTVAGSPAVAVRDYHKQTVFLRKAIKGV